MTRRARFVRMWYTPTWEWFITEAVARGDLSAPGFFDNPLVRAAYCGVSWSGPTMPQVNELDAANAMSKRLELTATTLEEETAAATGTSWMRKFSQVKKERQMLAAAGIPAAQDTVTTRGTEPLPPPPPVEQQ
jgi:capsid protein